VKIVLHFSGVIISPETMSDGFIPEINSTLFEYLSNAINSNVSQLIDIFTNETVDLSSLDLSMGLDEDGKNPTDQQKTKNLVKPEKTLNNLDEEISNDRISTISIVQLDPDLDNLTDISEISALFTYVGCKETHKINKMVTERFGNTAHIAFTSKFHKVDFVSKNS